MTGDDSAQIAVEVIIAAGVPAFLGVLGRGVYRWLTGKTARDRARNTNIETQRQRAIEERDRYDARGRKALEEVSRLRGVLLEHGIDPGAWHEDLDRTLTREEIKRITKPKGTTS